jgi:predicted PurR-regulated permease PerM
VLATLSANQSSITVGALTTAATIGEMVTELLLVLFTLIFFLHDGPGIWQFLLGAAPADVRTRPQDVHTSEPEATGPDEPGIDRQRELTT